ncbi:unnamed protein product [Ectocarpus sp. 13 AM-2016]
MCLSFYANIYANKTTAAFDSFRCNHGGHNGHLEDWFVEHDTCGVRGCDCKCTSHDLPIVSKIA